MSILQKDSESDYDDSIEVNTSSAPVSVVPMETAANDGVKIEIVEHSLPTSEPKLENITSMFDTDSASKDQQNENGGNFAEDVLMNEIQSHVENDRENISMKAEDAKFESEIVKEKCDNFEQEILEDKVAGAEEHKLEEEKN